MKNQYKMDYKKIEDKVLKILFKEKAPEDLDGTLVDYGIDSLTALEAFLELEHTFDTSLTELEEDFPEHNQRITPRRIINYLASKFS